MNNLPRETGGGQNIFNGLRDVEGRRTDFQRGGLDETVHLFKRDAVGREDERRGDGVDADVGGPFEGGGERRVAEGFFREGVRPGLRIRVVDAVVEEINYISFFEFIFETSHQFKRYHEIDIHGGLQDIRRSILQRHARIDGGVVDKHVGGVVAEGFDEAGGGARLPQIRLDDAVDSRIRQGGDKGLRLPQGGVAVDDDGVAFAREIAGNGRADAFGRTSDEDFHFF